MKISRADGGERRGGDRLDGQRSALPVLSNRPKVLYNYFKQLFAQVTNPPIDPIREELVMSPVTFIGPGRICSASMKPIRDATRGRPVLTAEEMEDPPSSSSAAARSARSTRYLLPGSGRRRHGGCAGEPCAHAEDAPPATTS